MSWEFLMTNKEQIIFFDGVCNLCNGFVDFLVKVDTYKMYKFSSLQGETAKDLLPEHFRQNLSTVVLLKEGQVSIKADAVIQIVSGLGPFWNLVNIFRLFPFKNFLYEHFSRKRYEYFGQKESCRIPTLEESTRFLP